MPKLDALDIRNFVLNRLPDFLYDLPGRGQDDALRLFPFDHAVPDRIAESNSLAIRKVTKGLRKRIEDSHRVLVGRQDLKAASQASADELRARLIS